MKTTTKKTKQGGEDATKQDHSRGMEGFGSLEDYLDYVNARMKAVRTQMKQKSLQQERAP